jgi:Skp family chaperone for outer membrane proteins
MHTDSRCKELVLRVAEIERDKKDLTSKLGEAHETSQHLQKAIEELIAKLRNEEPEKSREDRTKDQGQEGDSSETALVESESEVETDPNEVSLPNRSLLLHLI